MNAHVTAGFGSKSAAIRLAHRPNKLPEEVVEVGSVHEFNQRIDDA